MKNKEIDKNYEDKIKEVSEIDKTKLSNDLLDKDRNDLSKLKEGVFIRSIKEGLNNLKQIIAPKNKEKKTDLDVNEKSKKEKLKIKNKLLISTKNELNQLYASIPNYYSDYAKKGIVEHAQVDEVNKLQSMVRDSKNDSNPIANVSGKIANWLLS